MHWMLLPLKRYAEFSGRSRRKEYWLFTLFITLVALAIFIAYASAGGAIDENGLPAGGSTGVLIVGGLFYLAILVPSIAVQVRRFHDQDKSGWLVLLNFLPYVGSLIVFVFMCLPGTRGPNRFGEDPKGGDLNEVFG